MSITIGQNTDFECMKGRNRADNHLSLSIFTRQIMKNYSYAQSHTHTYDMHQAVNTYNADNRELNYW